MPGRNGADAAARERRLLLLRHAKSSWDDPSLADFDRPLAARGREAAPRVGRLMARSGWLPDLAIISPALRTRQTFDLVAADWPRRPDVTFDGTIYESGAQALLRAIRQVPARAGTLLVVGHNPGLETLAALLCGPGGDGDAHRRLREKFPTAALARLAVAGEWDALDAGTARLDGFHTPRDLA